MIPQTKANETIVEIQQIYNDRHPSEFALAKIDRSGQTLISSGVAPAVGHMIVGTTAAMRFDVESFLHHYRIACSLSPDRGIQKNFAALCHRLGFMVKNFEILSELAAHYPDDIDIVRCLLGASLDSVNIDAAKRAVSQLEKLGIDETTERQDSFPISRFDKAMELMKSLSLSRALVMKRVEVAASVLRENKEAIFGVVYDFSPRGTFSYGFSVRANLDEVVDLNILIAGKLVAAFNDTLADFLTITCVTYRDGLHTKRLSDNCEAVQ